VHYIIIHYTGIAFGLRPHLTPAYNLSVTPYGRVRGYRLLKRKNFALEVNEIEKANRRGNYLLNYFETQKNCSSRKTRAILIL
jgi:hypothetical protein